jgi:hypothetical protein
MNTAKAQRFSVVVDAAAPAPPYPADTRAKGWRFDLDYERIEQSDTWVLAPLDLRPWLLMIWLTAWKQVPCGSLPSQDELISARIGMELRQFRANRDLLMRGWDIHNDGRYYHHVITEQVLSLISGREKVAARQSRNRSKSTTYAAKSRDTDELLQSESHGSDASVTTPSPSPSPSPSEEKQPSVVGTQRKRSAATATKSPRASKRCPQDFDPTAELIEWVLVDCPGVNWKRETSNFKDWEFRSARSDWSATWRSWMRKAFDSMQQRVQTGQPTKLGRHTGFEKTDYRDGISDDGSF